MIARISGHGWGLWLTELYSSGVGDGTTIVCHPWPWNDSVMLNNHGHSGIPDVFIKISVNISAYVFWWYTLSSSILSVNFVPKFWLINTRGEIMINMCFKAVLLKWAGSRVMKCLSKSKQKFFKNILILAFRKHHLTPQKLSDLHKLWITGNTVPLLSPFNIAKCNPSSNVAKN